MKAHGGFIAGAEDLASNNRSNVRRSGPIIRGWEILGPPPPAASGVHIAQISRPRGLRHRGQGIWHHSRYPSSGRSAEIAFADRAAASGDPDFIKVPVARLTSKDYASERRRE